MLELEIKPTLASQLRISAVILAGICITGTLVFLLSGGGPDSFASKAQISTYMPDGTGLVKNSEVRLGGIRIGNVTKVDISGLLDPQRAVRVDMKLTARFLKAIPRDSQTSIGEDTLVGFKFVDIGRGNDTLLIADNGVLKSEPLKDAGDRANKIRTLQDELTQVDTILQQVSSPSTPIGHYIMGEQEYNDILKQVTEFERSMRAFVSPDNTLGDALFTSHVYDQYRQPIVQLDQTLSAIQRGEGPAGKLFTSEDEYNKVVKNLRDLHAALVDANAGKGQFGALLRDETAYRNIRKMLASTDAMLNALHAGEGGAGHLLQDPQLYESLNGSLRSLQGLLNDFRTDPRKYLRVKVF